MADVPAPPVPATRNPTRRSLLAGAAGLVAATVAGSSSRAATALDAALLDRAADRARRMERLRALVVGRGGRIALAEAFRGPPVDRPANVKSVSKTVMAALAGAAIDRGVLAGPEQKVARFLADSFPPQPDPRLHAITVDHLLTMRAGLERTSGPNYGRWAASPDWVRFVLSRPFVAEPGGPMLYSTGSYHLLSAVLTRAAGRSTLALARDWLGTPLGIEFPPWTRDPQGIYMGGNEMALSPLALYRLGECHRRGGEWEGRRVLSEAWIRASWQPRARSPFSGHDYGYGWFLARMRGHDLAYARGYGGQTIHVLPGLGLTVAILSDPALPARSGGYIDELHALVAEAIVPAAEAG